MTTKKTKPRNLPKEVVIEELERMKEMLKKVKDHPDKIFTFQGQKVYIYERSRTNGRVSYISVSGTELSGDLIDTLLEYYGRPLSIEGEEKNVEFSCKKGRRFYLLKNQLK